MQSGSIVNLGNVSRGQLYDALVTETGCSGANDTFAMFTRGTIRDVVENGGSVSGVIPVPGMHPDA